MNRISPDRASLDRITGDPILEVAGREGLDLSMYRVEKLGFIGHIMPGTPDEEKHAIASQFLMRAPKGLVRVTDFSYWTTRVDSLDAQYWAEGIVLLPGGP